MPKLATFRILAEYHLWMIEIETVITNNRKNIPSNKDEGKSNQHDENNINICKYNNITFTPNVLKISNVMVMQDY